MGIRKLKGGQYDENRKRKWENGGLKFADSVQITTHGKLYYILRAMDSLNKQVGCLNGHAVHQSQICSCENIEEQADTGSKVIIM